MRSSPARFTHQLWFRLVSLAHTSPSSTRTIPLGVERNSSRRPRRGSVALRRPSSLSFTTMSAYTRTDTHASAGSVGPSSPHCQTCTCHYHELDEAPHLVPSQQLPQSVVPLPPPLPEPTYSVRRRVLPASLVPLNSRQGTLWLTDCLTQNTAALYIPLSEHFCNQSDPAYCGVTTLLMVLNVFAMDPHVRWKHGWRYFGNEDVLLSQCCLTPERIRRAGISMHEFAQLASCQGVRVRMQRPQPPSAIETDSGSVHTNPSFDLDDLQRFRLDIQRVLSGTAETSGNPAAAMETNGVIVVSFSRAVLGQTGDGHFSPLAAYHAATDQVLVLDVARFKYPPYWVTVTDLYRSLLPHDPATSQSRGWYVLQPPLRSASYRGSAGGEDRRPAKLVPLVGEPHGARTHACPVQVIKTAYCQVAEHEPRNNDAKGP
jgi:glutathione gamma-glutamylcysteinyltransferase